MQSELANAHARNGGTLLSVSLVHSSLPWTRRIVPVVVFEDQDRLVLPSACCATEIQCFLRQFLPQIRLASLLRQIGPSFQNWYKQSDRNNPNIHHRVSFFTIAPGVQQRMASPGKWFSCSDRISVALLLLLMLYGPGCTRRDYRLAADRQSYEILTEKLVDPRWTPPRIDITPDARSRFYDPWDPDQPPLPPDDPAVHHYMHSAYGMRGWKGWHETGDIDNVENPLWPTYLDGEPFQAPSFPLPTIEKLGVREAIELGLIHSREYQEQVEDMYLQALSLTLDRYRFDVRPLNLSGVEPGTALIYEHQPDDASNLRLGPTSAGVSKLLPAGGQFIAELANNTLWLFSGSPDQTRTATTLAYSIVQPLMTGAGRNIAMEQLTQAERNVVYGIRTFARFRKDFYVTILTGEQALPLPGSAGSGELAYLIRGARSPTVGFYWILYYLQRFRNQGTNVQSLESLIGDLERLAEAGRATALDVTQLKSSLESARRRHMNIERAYLNQLDNFKVQLGLPPDVEVEIDDTLLKPFQFLNPDLLNLETRITDVELTPDSQELHLPIQQFRALHDELFERLHGARTEYQQTKNVNTVSEGQLSETEMRDREEDSQRTADQLQEIKSRLKALAAAIEQAAHQTQTPSELSMAQQITLMAELRRIRRDLLRTTRELIGLQIGIRTELITLQEIQFTPEEAVRLALRERNDLMNRRGFLMDTRRRLEVAADRLEATLNLVAEGELNTPDLISNADPFKFRSDTSSFRAGIQVVTPLDRVEARNNFRAAQISYQRARRNYMASEDQVKLDVRKQLRTAITQARLFEINRRALKTAARELDQSVEFGERPGTQGTPGSQGLNISRALDNIILAQDELIESWVDYETARLSFYRDTGTMAMTDDGFWAHDTNVNLSENQDVGRATLDRL